MQRGTRATEKAIGAIVGGVLALLLGLACPSRTAAQQVNIGANHHRVGSSYFESIGTNFGFYFPGRLDGRGRGIVGLTPDGRFTPNGAIWFTQGSNGVIPAFGGYDPNSGLRTGWSVRGPNGGFHFGLHATQGSSTTLGGDSMLLTLPHGGSGMLYSGSVRPFVTGIVPVLGGGPTYLPPLTRDATPERPAEEPVRERTGTAAALRSGSSAERGDLSLAALRAAAAAEDAADEEARKAEVERMTARALKAREEGKEALAGSYLKSALRRATPEEAKQIETAWGKR